VITDAVLSAALGVWTWLGSLFPHVDLPSWFVDFGATVNGFFTQFAGLGAWAPWPLLGACAALSLLVWVVCIVVKGLRAVASYIPFFGGAG
jgi:hypothetical protein